MRLILLLSLILIPACGSLGYSQLPSESMADPAQATAILIGQQIEDTVKSVTPDVVDAVIEEVEKIAYGAGTMKAPTAPARDDQGLIITDAQGRVVWDWQPAGGLLAVILASGLAWWRSKKYAADETATVNQKRKDLAKEHYALASRVRDMEVKNGSAKTHGT